MSATWASAIRVSAFQPSAVGFRIPRLNSRVPSPYRLNLANWPTIQRINQLEASTLRSRVSAIGYLVQVFGFGFGVKLFHKPITKNNLTKNIFICLFLSNCLEVGAAPCAALAASGRADHPWSAARPSRDAWPYPSPDPALHLRPPPTRKKDAKDTLLKI